MQERHRLVLAVLGLLVALGLFRAAYVSSSYWQAILSSLALTISGASLTEIFRIIRPWLANRYPFSGRDALIITLSFYAAFATYFAWLPDRPVTDPPVLYADNGSIIDLTSGGGGAVRTAQGTQCSFLSDSAWNGKSTVSYARVDDTSPGSGYVDLEYHLAAADGHDRYAGMYCPFSLPAGQSFDVSAFRSLHLDLRLGEKAATPPDVILVVLYSKCCSGAGSPITEYAFPTFVIEGAQLSRIWKSFDIPFDLFRRPHYVPYSIVLDRKSVYQIAIVLMNYAALDQTGESRKLDAIGSVNFKDVRFSK